MAENNRTTTTARLTQARTEFVSLLSLSLLSAAIVVGAATRRSLLLYIATTTLRTSYL